MKAVKIEISGLKDGVPIRLTECGSIPLVNGAVIRVPIDVGTDLCERHPAYLKIPGKTPHSVPVEDVAETFKYEILKGKADPVATDKEAKPSKVAVPSNKALLKGQVQEK